jgi:hypothetical protein
MYRILSIAAVAMCSVMVASAGQIQIGGVNGLSQAYITNPNTVAGQDTTGCAGGGTCLTGSVGAYTEQNYDNVLFAGATNGATAPTPYSTYNQFTGEVGSLTDGVNNIKFSMINDGTSGSPCITDTASCGTVSNNFWAAPQTCSPTCTSPSIVIPVGVFGVTDVWTMLNTELSTQNVKATSFAFTFGSQSNGGTEDTILVKLNDSASSSTPSGELQNAVDCVPASSCGSMASGPTLAGPTTISGVNVLTGNVYTSLFNNGPLTGYPGGTNGNIVLDDQGFLFNSLALTGGLGTNLSSYLVSVTVQEIGATAGVSPALSAITVDTAGVPEPSTILMFLSGLGAIGLARFRRK